MCAVDVDVAALLTTVEVCVSAAWKFGNERGRLLLQQHVLVWGSTTEDLNQLQVPAGT